MSKIQTAEVKAGWYYSLISHWMFPEEKKKDATIEQWEQMIYCTVIQTFSKGGKWGEKIANTWID